MHPNVSKYITFDENGDIILPNVKKLFIADEGMEILDGDLSGADAIIYGRDSDCKALNDFFDNPKGKLYAWVASMHLQRDVSPDEDIYKLYKASHHGVWYGMGEDKLRSTLGCTQATAKTLIDFYDYLYPEKKRWHQNLQQEVKKNGYVSNIFGARRYFLNTNDKTRLNKLYAYKPSSTIAEVINRGWINVVKSLNQRLEAEFGIKRMVRVLMQVHDSLVCTYPIKHAELIRPEIQQAMLIKVPYPKPCIIPSDFKVSVVSYGDCAKLKR